GGCCGTTPAHLARLIERVRAPRAPERPTAQADGAVRVTPPEPLPHERAASGMRAVSLVQDPPPTLVGERINSQGSRRVKELLLAEDYDGMLESAREQVEGGAHILDGAVALTERADEAEQMRRVVKKLSMGVETPLMIDTTEADVVEAALSTA